MCMWVCFVFPVSPPSFQGRFCFVLVFVAFYFPRADLACLLMSVWQGPVGPVVALLQMPTPVVARARPWQAQSPCCATTPSLCSPEMWMQRVRRKQSNLQVLLHTNTHLIILVLPQRQLEANWVAVYTTPPPHTMLYSSCPSCASGCAS